MAKSVITDSLPASLPEAFVRALGRCPEKPLLRFEGRAHSYAELHRQVAQAAGALRAWGLSRGERVALYLENSPSFVVAYLATLWLGGVVVPVNTRYRESELRHMLRDSGARLAITDAEGATHLTGASAETPELAATLELSGNPDEDAHRWTRLASGDPLPHPTPLAPDDLAVIGYTSGTTGRSKGAMLSHGNFLANSAAVTAAWRWEAADVLLLALPLFHMHGLGVGLHGTLLQGSSIVLKRKFEADAVYDALLSGGVTMFFGVPTMYARLLEIAKHRGAKPTSLRLLVSGSAPMSAQLHREVEAILGQKILERYGMTETVMNLGNPYDGERRPGTVGIPFAGVELRVADPETNAPLPPGETGELQLKGPNVTRGYWNRPDATAAAFSADGWFKTGDLGVVGEGGYVTISGRAKELIISGGFNVYPREVEEVIAEVPGVREVAVLGLPDADLGEKVVAAVVGEADDEAILARCKAIAGFKKPREIHHLAELPRNALGKVQKHLLKQALEPH